MAFTVNHGLIVSVYVPETTKIDGKTKFIFVIFRMRRWPGDWGTGSGPGSFCPDARTGPAYTDAGRDPARWNSRKWGCHRRRTARGRDLYTGRWECNRSPDADVPGRGQPLLQSDPPRRPVFRCGKPERRSG